MGRPLPVVVFSDVDGVLRDPGAASLAQAAAALHELPAENVALVLCSSHTRAELELIQQQLGIVHPFIAEDGAAVLIPNRYFGRRIPNARELAGYEAVEFSLPHAEVVTHLREIAERLGISIAGFSDMSIEEVARDCGVTLLRARLAKLREYVEPCRPVYEGGVTRSHFLKALQAARLRTTQRGGYEFVGGALAPGGGVVLLKGLYQRVFGPMLSIGLADAAADEDLLSLMDSRVIVQDDESCDGAVDVVCWAESIVEMVTERRQRTPALAGGLGQRVVNAASNLRD